MRALILLFLLYPHIQLAAQAVTTNAAALSMIARLEADPMHDDARADMDAVFQWLDKTDSAVVVIADADMNAIYKRMVPYNRGLYILLLGGMARFDLAHPDTDIEDATLDRAAGYQCMCNGYRNTLRIHAFKQDKYFKKLCKAYPAQ
jgi:hypothetical protein